MNHSVSFLGAIACGFWATLLCAQDDPDPSRHGSRQPVQTSTCNNIPAHAFDIVLGRPTADGITFSILCNQDVSGQIAYGTTPGSMTGFTAPTAFKKGEPSEMVISKLNPNTKYYYQFRAGQISSPVYTFHTARSPGSPFVFSITADSHLDEHTDPALYQQTLAAACSSNPDFHIDLGDTFMTEKHPTREAAARQYVAQRFYFGQLCHSAPLFLILGNHDGENPRGRDDGPESLAVWSNLQRKRYFPNPFPSGFYTGNATPHPSCGPLQDYCAWEWGDALFVALDPFWFGQRQRGASDNWARTLGSAQYRWLKQTLETSHAKYKFIFIHHLVGGTDRQNRGGVEAAKFYEWGGSNADGSPGFAEHRPGWSAPIHQLLVKSRVSAVFHGHDHLYACQNLDGIIYQEMPQPGTPDNGRAPRSAVEYGYVNGVILGSPGHLRVTVSPDFARVEYLQTTPGQPQKVVHAYRIPPNGSPSGIPKS